MNSDDIYKFIGYAVVIIFGFYIISKSLNFQIQMVEQFTCKGDENDDDLSEEELEKRKSEEIDNSKSINKSIKEMYINNNKNLKEFNIIDKSLIEEYNKLINNYIQSEKINVFNIINNKNKDITFNSVINDLKDTCEKVESLKRTIDYLSASSGDDLKQTVENEPEEQKETDSEKKDREDAEKKLNNELIEINKNLLKENNKIIKCISNTQKKLKDSYIKLLNAYKTEEYIYISDIILTIGEDVDTYDENMKKIENHNININVLRASETIISELFNNKKD